MSINTGVSLRSIKDIMKNIISHASNTRVPLGRWGVTNNICAQKLTIDYANEDHCGACSEYIRQKTNDAVIHQHKEELFYYEYADMNTNTQTKNRDL